MAREWWMAPQDLDLARRLSEHLHVHPLVGQLLVNRGVVDVESGRRYLDRKLSNLHDPELLPGAVEAADRIHSAARAGKRIVIYGDYDVDGMCATAILLQCLRLASADVRFHVPDRLEEGYGVNADSLARLRDAGAELIVTVDCGIASVLEARRARELGLEYIVTDHHEPADELPAAEVIVHPRLGGSVYPFGAICGTMVAFKLAWEIGRRFSGARKTGERFRRFLLDATSLAALGTVCDVVPILDENRVVVHHGLTALRASPAVGLAALMEQAGLDKKNRLEASDLGFVLGPRLNACGRLGQARLGVELLTTADAGRASELARYLEDENRVRQTLERRIFSQARELFEEECGGEPGRPSAPPAIVLADADWHPGVIGIVASRMVERYHRPCILIAMGEEKGTGSGRSIPRFHLQRALLECGEHLLGAGGHAMAAGLRLTREQLGPFRDRFRAIANAALSADDLVARQKVDLETPLHVLTPNLIRALAVLEPFGLGNPAPVLLATDLDLVGTARRVGGGERHLSFRVRQRGSALRAIAFGQGERAEQLVDANGKCCVIFSPSLDEYQGFPRVQLRVKDFRAGPRLVEVPA